MGPQGQGNATGTDSYIATNHTSRDGHHHDNSSDETPSREGGSSDHHVDVTDAERQFNELSRQLSSKGEKSDVEKQQEVFDLRAWLSGVQEQEDQMDVKRKSSVSRGKI